MTSTHQGETLRLSCILFLALTCLALHREMELTNPKVNLNKEEDEESEGGFEIAGWSFQMPYSVVCQVLSSLFVTFIKHIVYNSSIYLILIPRGFDKLSLAHFIELSVLL